MSDEYRDFWESGHKVFGLYGAHDGVCGCGDPECPALFKHPIASNWQYTPVWSEDQLETMEEMGQFSTGYGVLVEGLLVIDVDERNGGADSFERLAEDVPEIAGAGLVVRTGSGGASRHLYFSLPERVPLVQNLDRYPGIDFKSTGYVVGPGSQHASGNTYERLMGGPDDIGPAPASLVEALKKPERHRATAGTATVDVSDADIADMLDYIPNTADTDYEKWIRIGMAVHLVTGGEGYELWEQWSAKGPKHDARTMDKKWHSFGKSANPVTFGTLAHYAEEAGWVAPVEFTDDTHFELPAAQEQEPERALATNGVDLLRPPGFVGVLTQWINDRSRYPRESLAVAAALSVVSSAAGMRYQDPLDGITPNVFLFGVAGSATGKEAILKSATALLRAAGVAPAVHGMFKSEQEIYRNLVRHQLAAYFVDELGEHLAKIQNARSKGSAAYLEGIIGALLSIYSKASSFALITGDLKEEVRKALVAEYASVKKRIDENEARDRDHIRAENLERQLGNLDNGLERPYLNIFGLTTPERFNDLMDFDMAANGFLGRSLLFIERDDNPKSKPREKIKKGDVPDSIAATLQQLYAPGYSEVPERVERIGDTVDIPTRPDAETMLDQVEKHFHEIAEQAKDSTGLTAIPRRGYEQVAKVSMLLAIPEGLRTVEHVKWAFALVKRDIDEKMKLAHANSADDKAQALASRVMGYVTGEHGETIGRIRNKCRGYRKEDVDEVVRRLVDAGHLKEYEVSSGRGRSTKKYFAVTC